MKETPRQTSTERRLVAILFADIEGYTAVMQRDEASASILIRRFQTELEKEVHVYNGLIVQFYGDGVLCTFQTPLEAIHCSIALQQAFRQEPQVPVRIGVHSGTVVFEGEKIFGDSVNITSRIESMGIPGAVLFSKKVQDDLKNQTDIRMISLGSFDFKNVNEPLEVFALTNEGFPVPKAKELKGKFKDKKLSVGYSLIKNWKLTGLLLLLLTAGIIAVSQLINLKSETVSEKWKSSIAILPFETQNKQSEEDYFFDGIADEIRAQLAVVNGLKVISRSSSMAFDSGELSMKDIAKKLGVVYILTGRIQRFADMIRISVELNNAETDALEWSLPGMDRNIENIFAIQSEIAQEVVSHLKIELTPEEKILQTSQTEQPANVEAYEYFLNGRYIYHVKYLVSGAESDFILAKQLLKKAIDLDPRYASAIGVLADLHDAHGIVFNFHDTSIWKKDFRTRDSLVALGCKVNPNNPYVLLAKGWSFIEPVEGPVPLSHPNMDSAFQLFRKILEISPEDPFINMTMGNFLGYNVGLFQGARYHYQAALDLDPLREDLYVFLISIVIKLGQYEEAEKLALKAKGIAPDLEEIDLFLGIIHAKKGDLEGARNKLKLIENYEFSFWDNKLLLARLLLLTGQKEKALQAYEKAGAKLPVLLLEGKIDEAIEIINSRFNSSMDVWYVDLLNDDIYNSIRNSTEFPSILEKARLLYHKRLERFPLSYL